jgi:hypothetical protein
MHGYATAAELLALGEEAFAGVAFTNEGIVFVAELIPEFVEELVVGAMDDVAQSNQQIRFIAQNGGRVSYSCSIVSVTSSKGRNWRSSPGYLRRKQIFWP